MKYVIALIMSAALIGCGGGSTSSTVPSVHCSEYTEYTPSTEGENYTLTKNTCNDVARIDTTNNIIDGVYEGDFGNKVVFDDSGFTITKRENKVVLEFTIIEHDSGRTWEYDEYGNPLNSYEYGVEDSRYKLAVDYSHTLSDKAIEAMRNQVQLYRHN